MRRPLQWYDTITLNIYFFGLTTLFQTMTPLVTPLLVQQFVGDQHQGTYYGTIRLWSLMTALLVQSLSGIISDRTTLRWGRRRPFIFAGTLADLIIIIAIGFIAGMEGITGYWILFVLIILLNVSSNTAQSAAQGLIPDLVPAEQRGRFAGIKAILEVPLPLILVSFTIGKMIATGNLWAGLITVMIVLSITMLITMFAPEKSLVESPLPLNWTPFIRLAMMTALFTAIILAMREIVNWVGALLLGNNTTLLLVWMSVLGFLAMTLTVGLGVWLSIRIGIGEGYRENQSFTWWVVNRLAFLVGSTNLASFAVFFLQGRLGLVKEEAVGPASQLIMFVGFFILILAFPSGWLADRFGRKPLIGISGWVAAFGTLVLVVSSSLTTIFIGAILVGAATGLFYSANWALGTDLVPKSEAGRYLGISNLAGAGAGAVGAYIGGPIADFFSVNVPETPGLGYVVLFSIYGMLFIVSILALRQVEIPDSAIVAG